MLLLRTYLRPNKIIKYLILSDLAFWTGWGLIDPIFAIFIEKRIEGEALIIAGTASAVFWIVRSLVRIPISILLDAVPSEKDDYFALIAGLFVASLVPFGFIFAVSSLHVYLLQAIHGVALAMSLAGWTAIFTRHIGKGKESTDWGLNATSLGLGTGLAGALGGWLAGHFGFNLTFIIVGVLGLIGTFLLFGLRNEIKGVFDSGLSVPLKKIFNGHLPETEQEESRQ